MSDATSSPLMAALEVFEAAEANLIKLERLWSEIAKLIPRGVAFGENPEYEDRCRSFAAVLAALPKIAAWKPTISLPDINEIGQSRFDAMEVGDIEAKLAVENWLSEPGQDIREYRFRFNNKRRQLIRDVLVELIDVIDDDIRTLRGEVGTVGQNQTFAPEAWDRLRSRIQQIEVLLGSSVERPAAWPMLRRHVGFAQVIDLDDIEKTDWPSVKAEIRRGLYGINEPLPVAVADLDDIVAAKPRGPILTKLQWATLNAEGFERLIFALIASEQGYENPEWLMHTNAPDRGRDLSVMRVVIDRLTGTMRSRVVIQCRHGPVRSIGVGDVSVVKEQMKLWGDPRVDVLIFATSGRFTADAVQWIEKHNAAGVSPRIEMWPESHLEQLLAARPALIAEFTLR